MDVINADSIYKEISQLTDNEKITLLSKIDVGNFCKYQKKSKKVIFMI